MWNSCGLYCEVLMLLSRGSVTIKNPKGQKFSFEIITLKNKYELSSSYCVNHVYTLPLKLFSIIKLFWIRVDFLRFEKTNISDSVCKGLKCSVLVCNFPFVPRTWNCAPRWWGEVFLAKWSGSHPEKPNSTWQCPKKCSETTVLCFQIYFYIPPLVPFWFTPQETSWFLNREMFLVPWE